jgi:hypothetical protein
MGCQLYSKWGKNSQGVKPNGCFMVHEEILSGNFLVFAEDISNVKLKALFLEVEHEGISGLKT